MTTPVASAVAAVAEVAVTLPVPGRYHYLVPASLAGRARVGARVLVRFGNKKVTGVVVPPVSKPPVGIKLVELSEVLDDDPALSPELVDLCLWVADYYEAPPGEAMRAALPAGSGISAQRLVGLTAAGRTALAGDGAALPAKQHALLARLASGPMSATGQNEATRRGLEALRERGLVEDHEKRDSRVRLKTERVATLVGAIATHVGAALDGDVGANDSHAGAAPNAHVGAIDTHAGAAPNAEASKAHVGAIDTRAGAAPNSHVGAGPDAHVGAIDTVTGAATNAHVGAIDTHAGAVTNPHMGAATNPHARAATNPHVGETPALAHAGAIDTHAGAAPNAHVGAIDTHVGAAPDAHVGAIDTHVGAAATAVGAAADAHVGATPNAHVGAIDTRVGAAPDAHVGAIDTVIGATSDAHVGAIETHVGAAPDAHVGAIDTHVGAAATAVGAAADAQVGATPNAHVGAIDTRVGAAPDAHVGAIDTVIGATTDAHVGASETHVGTAANADVGAIDTHAGAAANAHVGAIDTHAAAAPDAHVGAIDTVIGATPDAHVGAIETHVGTAANADVGAIDTHAGAAANAHVGAIDTHAGAAATAHVGAIDTVVGVTDVHVGAIDTHAAAAPRAHVGAIDSHASAIDTHAPAAPDAHVGAIDTPAPATPDAHVGAAADVRRSEAANRIALARAAFARAPKKLAALDALLAADGHTMAVAALNKIATGVVGQLVKLGVAVVSERELALDAAPVGEAMAGGAPPELTGEQAHAVAEITGAMASSEPKKPFLLHGVTGSGKTEVYLRVIARTLEAGKTALVLVPEISLTPQLAARFRARFGDKVAILHSGLTEQQRLGEWSRLHRGEATIAVGARSAVFAPLANIGVIVVDEEHDGSFKQDEGVRYHGRDVALVRAQRAGAVAVLGSATPSLESYAHAERGAYRLLVLTQRPTARPMPEVQIVDLRTHLPDGDAFLSSPLRNAIGETLANGDQTILFLNRRGFATFVLCRACGHSFRCDHCSVSLTYHRNTDRLDCHYCGTWQRIPETCPSCGGKDTIVRKGLGTEKVADAVAAEFPQARVARLDRDVASGSKIEAVLSRVARREVDILVGTQMVTKGHDFPGVTLVGVLCADTGLNVPDFRASERTFQLLAQVAGRAGRGERAGRVIIQTYRPESAAVTCAAAHDYESFFASESAARADPDLMYPPHGRLIAVRIDGPNAGEIATSANRLAQVAEAVARRPENDGHVIVRGAVPAPIEKLRNRTRWQIWLRGSDRAALRRVARAVLATEVPTKVRVGLDVDPISTL